MANPETESNWYTIARVEHDLQQGDFLNSFPVLIPSFEVTDGTALTGKERDIEIESEAKWFNVVILTQSCDLLDMRPADPVILCPRFSYKELSEKEDKEYQEAQEAHRQFTKQYGKTHWPNYVNGRRIGKYILNKCDLEGYKFDYQLVDLKQIYTAPFELVRVFAKHRSPRIRLLSPYCEHLAQSFASQFMRVGLPIPVPKNYPY